MIATLAHELFLNLHLSISFSSSLYSTFNITIDQNYAKQLAEDVHKTIRILKQNGFFTSQEGVNQNLCNRKDIIETDESRKENLGNSNMFVCVWGSRINNLEFSESKWFKWSEGERERRIAEEKEDERKRNNELSQMRKKE
jgi:hypothetical protein